MKPPSKSIVKSLAGQSGPRGRMSESVTVSGMKRGVSLTVPGDGDVGDMPAAERVRNGERSARHYTAPQRRFGGG